MGNSNVGVTSVALVALIDCANKFPPTKKKFTQGVMPITLLTARHYA